MKKVDLKEKLVESKLLYDGKIIKLRCDTVTLPDGALGTREIVEHPGAVAIVPITADGRIILVRQYRHAVQALTLEIPAGTLAQGEDPLSCAYRELEEETGYSAGSLQYLSSVYTTPGFTTEKIHLYVAGQLSESKQRTDDDEFINVEIYTSEQIRSFVDSGTICDAKTMLALLLSGVIS